MKNKTAINLFQFIVSVLIYTVAFLIMDIPFWKEILVAIIIILGSKFQDLDLTKDEVEKHDE